VTGKPGSMPFRRLRSALKSAQVSECFPDEAISPQSVSTTVSTTVLKKGRSTKKTTRELSEQNACDGLSKRSNGPSVMPLHAFNLRAPRQTLQNTVPQSARAPASTRARLSHSNKA
jgi:hypothetical protein